MSSTLLRLGLYTILIVIALYVVAQTYGETSPVATYIPIPMLVKALGVGVLLVISGIVAAILEKGAKAVSKNRCAVCRTPIPPGAIYCRAHLRRVLQTEEDKTHMTRVRR